MTTLRLGVAQVRYTNKEFWRNPSRAFFTFAFPLMFLVIFTSILGNGYVQIGTLAVKQSTYYVAAMAAFAVITSCFNNVAISAAFQRDAGILKRMNGTPLPSTSFLGGRVVHSTVIAALLVALTAVFGRVVYSAKLPTGTTLVEFVIMLIVGAATFCALGLAVTAAIPNADAAAPVVNGVILPLLFLSGIFIPFGNDTPTWIKWVSRIFPVRHFAAGMQAAFIGTPFRWSDVVIVAVWGIVGLVLAVRFFSWEPRV